MKVTVDDYKINKDLSINVSKKFISFSDIHYGLLQQIFYKGYMEKFLKYIVKTQKDVDAILLPGDLLFWMFKYQDSKFLKSLSHDLKDLSFKLGVPVFISYGNHDLPFNEEKLSQEEKEFWSLKKYLDDRANGIYVLDNEQVRYGDTVVTGFSPKRSAYAPAAMPNEALDMAFESFNSCNFKFNSNDLNIVLSHDNKFLTYPENASRLESLYKNITLIVGGHLHDGYVPIWLQRLLKDSIKDNGIWEKIPATIDSVVVLLKYQVKLLVVLYYQVMMNRLLLT